MAKMKIAFQGELGAYSHIAVNEIFQDPEIKTCSTFEETFKVAFEDDTHKIIIPLENSLAGRVADIHYLLPKYKLQIHGEHFQKVEHNVEVLKENVNFLLKQNVVVLENHVENLENQKNLENLENQ